MTTDIKLDAEQVSEVLRTQTPPPGFEKFAVALGTVAGAPERVFGVSADPFRPMEIMTSPGSSFAVPPRCPTCHSLLQAIVQNPAGDTLFECLFDGYEAVLRRSTQHWEPRPGRETPDWVPPRFGESPDKSTVGASTPTRQPMAPRAQAAVVQAPPAAPVEATLVEGSPVSAVPTGGTAVVAPQGAEGTEWLTLVEAAAVTGRSVNEIYKLVRKGTVPRQKNEKGLVQVNMDVLLGLGSEAAGG